MTMMQLAKIVFNLSKRPKNYLHGNGLINNAKQLIQKFLA